MIPWLIYALLTQAGVAHADAMRFIAQPWNATLLTLTFLVLLYHGMLGLQVVIEDYIHRRALELVLHFAVRALTILAAVLGMVHILRIVLGAGS